MTSAMEILMTPTTKVEKEKKVRKTIKERREERKIAKAEKKAKKQQQETEVKEVETNETVEEKTEGMKFNPVEMAAIAGAVVTLKVTDFIVDDLICGGLKDKIKEKKIIEERKSFFANVKQKAAELKDKIKIKKSDKEEHEVVSEEEIFGTELAVVDPVEEEDKGLFSVVDDTVKKDETLNNVLVNELIKKYNYSGKLLAAAILWLCGKIDEKQVGGILMAIDNNEKYYTDNINFINSVTKYFCNRNFASSPIFKDVEFNINPKDLKLVVTDMSHLDTLSGNEVLSVIIDKTRKYVQEKTGEYIIIFDNAKLDLFKSDAPKSLVTKVETYFGKFMDNMPHIVTKLDTGMLKLSVKYDAIMEPRDFVIDPGIAFGTDYKVRAFDEEGNTIFISPAVNETIVANIFNDPNYRVSMKDSFDCLTKQHNFRQYDLYVNYDFSACNQKIADLTFEEQEALMDKLMVIRKMIENKFSTSPRMRIKNFKNVNAFIVVSDNKCKVQYEEFSSSILQGLRVKVIDSKYTLEITDENGNLIQTNEYSFVEGSESMMRNPFADYAQYANANNIFQAFAKPEEEEKMVTPKFTK